MILSCQWTKDGSGFVKKNHIVNGTLDSVSISSDDKVTVDFSDGYYTFNFTVPKSGDEIVLRMTDPSGEVDSNAPYKPE